MSEPFSYMCNYNIFLFIIMRNKIDLLLLLYYGYKKYYYNEMY